MAMEPDTSHPLRNNPNPLCIRFKYNPSDKPKQNHPRTFKPPTQPSSDDSKHTQRDSEDTVEAAPENSKPAAGDGVAAKKQKVSFADETAANANVKPWNLRNRKATIKTPHEVEDKGKRCLGSSVKWDEATTNKKNSEKVMKKTEMAKFSVALSMKEIEQDFLTLFGKKPTRRPKKRPRNVQNDVDYISPACNLPKVVTAELYKVRGGHH